MADPLSSPDGMDAFLDGALRLRQPHSGHRSGTDAVLLAASVGRPAGHWVDAGAGVGAIGLMLARRAPALEVTLVEIDPAAAVLARENAALNGVEERVRIIECDLLSAKARREAGLADNGADGIVSNPPFLSQGHSRPSPDARRALAHVAGEGGLAAWMRSLAAIARADAQLNVIVRGEDLSEILAACEGRFGNLAILPVHARESEAALRLLIAGRKGARARPRILPGLVLHGADGRFTPLAEALHRGQSLLDLK